MRKTSGVAGFIVGFLLIVGQAAAADLQAHSKISRVTVFSSAALVTRSASLQVEPGEHRVVFADVVATIDENSLNVSGAGSAQAKILGAQVQKEYLKDQAGDEVARLEKEIQALIDERRGLTDALEVAAQEREFLNSLRFYAQGQLPKDLVTKLPSVEEVGGLLGFLDSRLKENFAVFASTDIKIRDIDKKIEKLQRELAQVSGGGKVKRSVVVDIQVAKAGALDIDVAYLAMGASWRPLYDARASFDKRQVEMVCYGIVNQRTQEDWTDAQVTLSTARPALGGRMPEPQPWVLEPLRPREMMQLGGAVMARKSAAPMAASFEADGIGGPAEDKGVYDERMKMEQNYAAVEESGFSVVYRIPGVSTIKTDGTDTRLPIFTQTLAAEFKYSAYPKGAPFAYLMSRVTNAQELQLLPGRVNIFLDGNFVGASQVDAIGPSETFDLYLGVDENVKVKKEMIARKADNVLMAGIPSPTMKVTLEYKITVENYKKDRIVAEIFDAVPVSADERIKVRIERAAPEPKQKDWKDRKGVWRWEMSLEPRAKQEIFSTVVVEHPRQMQVEGLEYAH
jgi:uncharacterized protein (TIGR02231 family)